MTRRALLLTLFLFTACVPAASADAPASFDARGAYVFAPKRTDRPLQVVFALHGMGGEGKGFCQMLLAAAERNGWLVVAPTFAYRNWRDPRTVADDDVALIRSLAELLDALPERVGRPVSSDAVLVGFSRGAQLAHRFAMRSEEHTSELQSQSNLVCRLLL